MVFFGCVEDRDNVNISFFRWYIVFFFIVYWEGIIFKLFLDVIFGVGIINIIMENKK